jgi:hypothetical protein
MRRPLAHEKGFALAVAMLALVVIGALIAGAFFASTQEYRVGRNTLVQSRALAAAERGVSESYSALMRSWVDTGPNHRMSDSVFTKMTRGQRYTWQYSDVAGQRSDVVLTKLSNASYEVTSVGVANPGTPLEAKRRTSVIVRFDTPDLNVLGALTTRGPTKISGSAQVIGTDQTPTGWSECDSASTAKPGLAIDQATDIDGGSCDASHCIGNPGVLVTPVANDTMTYFNYGGLTWPQLKAMATKVVPNGGPWNGLDPRYNADGSCNKSDFNNWGDPYRNNVGTACDGYYPIIYYNGNLTINDNSGQGILLVEGDLAIQGQFEFVGAVIVRGGVKLAGGGAHITGALMAANVDISDTNSLTGGQEVKYSKCALQKALMAAAVPQIAKGRAWADKL